ncbi:hypothetical protein [Metallosphaera hakonensis]|uniref:hypothetical protein n=1 Tax=Metallosphaera hakonensis TaxID=79601 RepID=UPI0006D05A52|nr:hypothetical protein [Metallosphaera hakonensis]
MEAYVFWHRRDPNVPKERYEEYLKKFHEGLRQFDIRGFLGSASYRVDVPWMPKGDIYEDWYFILDSGVLDRLIEVVEGGARTIHDEVASFSAEGKGALFALKSGKHEILSRDIVTWISKPRGVSYEKFYSSLEIRGTLWRRLLAMGPTPEFCIIDREPLSHLGLNRFKLIEV